VGRPLASVAALAVAAVVFGASVPSTAVGRVVVDRSPADGWSRVQTRPPAHVIAYVRRGRPLPLRARPFGRVLAQVNSTTQFGSRRALSVVTKRGSWLGVTEAGVGNNRLVWVDARAGRLSYTRTRLEVDVTLSTRTLVLRRDGQVVRRMRVGVGRPGSPTPTGRFSVTDKLNGPAYSAFYGCCILALSATQPNLPAGWTGGNRIAIHGTPSSSDFGRAVSAGCVHASDVDLRYLMRTIPLGTPVVIKR
jgi:L,D-transpeptidase catalytic domain